MSRILFFLLFLCTPLSLAAQKSETFESISFQTPKGWQKEVGKESVQFAAENADGGLCLITMFKPIAGSGDAKTDFNTAWESVVQSTVKAGKPQMNPAGNDDGWAIENGAAAYESDGKKGVAGVSSNSSSSRFDLHGGFWFQNLAPTAAAVSITGRVLTANGQGIRNVRLTLTAPNGTRRTAITSTFGYYAFDGVEVGNTYVLEIASKRYTFTSPTRVFSLQDTLTDMDFTAEPQ